MRAPRDIVIGPPGRIATTQCDPFLVDARGAREIIATFRAAAVDLPIDYDHASTDPDRREGGAAPAAGWITELRWDAKRGLVASVNWTDRGRRYVENGEYRYKSPMGFVRKSDNRFVELAHVTLTNEPSTIGAVPLAAGRGNHRIAVAASRLQPIYAKKGKPIMADGTSTATVDLGISSELVDEFRALASALAAAVEGADANTLTAIGAMFTPEDMDMIETIVSQLRRVHDADKTLEPEAFARKLHPYERKLETLVATGRARNKLEAIRMTKKEEPRLFQRYRAERRADRKRTA